MVRRGATRPFVTFAVVTSRQTCHRCLPRCSTRSHVARSVICDGDNCRRVQPCTLRSSRTAARDNHPHPRSVFAIVPHGLTRATRFGAGVCARARRSIMKRQSGRARWPADPGLEWPRDLCFSCRATMKFPRRSPQERSRLPNINIYLRIPDRSEPVKFSD